MKNKPSVAKKAENEVAIKVENLSKTFKIPLEASSGIKQKLINTLKGVKGYREFTPLNDISFEINKGDFFGIVGRNGSGKSTLLKTMAGIYTPNAGSVTVNGSLVPFIELGVGFNPELTGRENVFLNGALLGFSHEEMEGMYQEIVDFAEIEEFMDEKLKNYSSGMQVRLAFSIAIQAKGDILLLDEVLAVGDEAFQRKCFDYFEQLKRDKKTVVLVTHSMDSVKKYCNKAMMINKGKIAFYGDVMKVADAYININNIENVSKEETRKDNEVIKDLFDLISVKKIFRGDRNVYSGINVKGDKFLIKKSGDDYRNEFIMATRLHKKDNRYFIKPISTKKEAKSNYIMYKWVDGVYLNDFLDKNNKSIDKDLLLEDLYNIGECLYKEGIIHRDLIPRNFIVSKGRLILNDYQWAVDYENYTELSSVKDNILHLSLLGEQFAKGRYEWDDAYSLKKISNYIVGGIPNKKQKEIITKIDKRVGERVVSPPIDVFSDSLNKQRQELIQIRKELSDCLEAK